MSQTIDDEGCRNHGCRRSLPDDQARYAARRMSSVWVFIQFQAARGETVRAVGRRHQEAPAIFTASGTAIRKVQPRYGRCGVVRWHHSGAHVAIDIEWKLRS